MNLDLMLGHTGVLIANALLLDAVAPMQNTRDASWRSVAWQRWQH